MLPVIFLFPFLPRESSLRPRYQGQDMRISFAMAKGSRYCDFLRTKVNKVYSWTMNSIGARPIIAQSTFQKSPDRSSRSFQLIRKRIAALLLRLIIVYNLHHQRPTQTYRASVAALLAVWWTYWSCHHIDFIQSQNNLHGQIRNPCLSPYGFSAAISKIPFLNHPGFYCYLKGNRLQNTQLSDNDTWTLEINRHVYLRLAAFTSLGILILLPFTDFSFLVFL